MSKRGAWALALGLVASCAPLARPSAEQTATPAAASASPSPAAGVATSDVLTIRQSGPGAASLFVRAAATGEVMGQLADGIVMPDGRTILGLEAGVDRTTLRAVDRLTGKALRSTSIPGTWKLRTAFGASSGLSPNGAWLALAGSAFNYTDAATGKWTAKTTFAVIDAAFTTALRTVDLDGNYLLEMLSDDGRSLYVTENTPPDRPTVSTLRVYDLATGTLGDISGDPLPPMNGFRTDTIPIGDGAYSLFVFGADAPFLARFDLNGRTARVTRIPTDRRPSGEMALLWSMTATRDGRTLYAVNPAAGVVHEIDAASLTVRRSGKVSTVDQPGPLAAILGWLAPIADAKMIVRSGALLSPDGGTLYAVGEDGIRAIDTRALVPKAFAAKGLFMDIALSPDAQRLYALNALGRWLMVFDARSGELLAQIDIGGFPQAIVAVDPQ